MLRSCPDRGSADRSPDRRERGRVAQPGGETGWPPSPGFLSSGSPRHADLENKIQEGETLHHFVDARLYRQMRVTLRTALL